MENIKIIISRLAYLFYEVYSRLFFLYNKKSRNNFAKFQFANRCKFFGIYSSMLFIAVNIGLIIRFLSSLIDFNVNFDNIFLLLFIGLLSYLTIEFTIDKNQYFEKIFIPKEEKLPLKVRVVHHLNTLIFWFILPILCAIYLILH